MRKTEQCPFVCSCTESAVKQRAGRSPTWHKSVLFIVKVKVKDVDVCTYCRVALQSTASIYGAVSPFGQHLFVGSVLLQVVMVSDDKLEFLVSRWWRCNCKNLLLCVILPYLFPNFLSALHYPLFSLKVPYVRIHSWKLSKITKFQQTEKK